jgi:hypothetical protein
MDTDEGKKIYGRKMRGICGDAQTLMDGSLTAETR